MSSRLLIATLSAALIAGCNTVDTVSGSVDPGFGEAVKYNAAIQTIDPAPVYTELDEQPGSSGAKGAAAVKRYRTDQVKDVQTQGTGGITGLSTGSGPQ